MARQTEELQIFLSSPGDVTHQRSVVRTAIEAVSRDPLVAARCRLDVVAWDTPDSSIPLSASVTPQVSINQHLTWPRDCDLTIVLLWGRLGTPLPKSMARANGSVFESGTVWELEDAKAGGKPVWIYRKMPPPNAPINDPSIDELRRQFQALERFLDGTRGPDGSIHSGMQEFSSDQELAARVQEHLRHYLAHRYPAGSLAETVAAAADAARKELQQRHDQAAASGVQTLSLAGDHLAWPELSRFPVGPMIRDISVSHLSESMAELARGEDCRAIFSVVNRELAAAAPDETPLRLAAVKFSDALGPKRFWEDVLYHAALNGPRMLAAVLRSVDRKRLDGRAAAEFDHLFTEVNRHVV